MQILILTITICLSTISARADNTKLYINSPYAMRFYELVANQDTTKPIPMNLDTFREWMGIR